MPASSLLASSPTYGDLLTDEQRRRVSARATRLGGQQFATDVLAWLDSHEPARNATASDKEGCPS